MKRHYSEADTRYQSITPVIEQAGWNQHQIHQEYSYTDGEVEVLNNNTTRRKKPKYCDYVLFYTDNVPLAVVEAKRYTKSAASGIQQVIEYATQLDIPYAYSTNGKVWIEHNRLTGEEREILPTEFPSPERLWQRFTQDKHYNPATVKLLETPYHFDPIKEFKPRYYQRNAINRTLEAIGRGEKRILLVMATGTGKTFTAFQIIHSLKKGSDKKKILYLADRNILVDQSMKQDFQPFKKVMTKVKDGTLDSAYDIYFGLYQQLVGDSSKKGEEPFRQLKPTYFDVVVVDECHRGSAKDDSNWRSILEYFSSAVQIGLTATPKETSTVSNAEYFGEPVYTYSLKQGIQDGFLAPYKVLRISLNVDLEGWRPSRDQKDKDGNLIEDRIYTQKDFDRNIVLDTRTDLVAKRITEFMQANDPMAKTIVFCVDIDHAERMRSALAKYNADQMQKDSRYIMKITGDDKVGKSQLDNFIDPNSPYPVIVTTSKLMTTGVDCKTCKVIVLDSCIESMTEFKQIIGRGTRLLERKNKMFFTIMDFRGNTKQFADPNFDGDAVIIKEIPEETDITDIVTDPFAPIDEPIGGGKIEEPSPFIDEIENIEDKEKKPKIVVVGRKGEVKVINETVYYYGEDGKPVTRSLVDFSRENVLNQYASLNDFLTKWNKEERKTAIITELKAQGVLIEELHELSSYKGLDDFDLICHIAFDKPPLSRRERANNVKKRGYLHKYNGIAKTVLQALLDKYAEHGVMELENRQILKNPPFRDYGAPHSIAQQAFGGKTGFDNAITELENEIYAA